MKGFEDSFRIDIGKGNFQHLKDKNVTKQKNVSYRYRN